MRILLSLLVALLAFPVSASHDPETNPISVTWHCGAGGKVCSPEVPSQATAVELITSHTNGGVDPGGRNESLYPEGQWITLDLPTTAGVDEEAVTVCLGGRGELNNADANGSSWPQMRIFVKRDTSVPDTGSHELFYKDKASPSINNSQTRNNFHICLAAKDGTIAFKWTKVNWNDSDVFGYIGMWVTQYTRP